MNCPLCKASNMYIIMAVGQIAKVESKINEGDFQIYTCDICKAKWIILLGEDGSKTKLYRD